MSDAHAVSESARSKYVHSKEIVSADPEVVEPHACVGTASLRPRQGLSIIEVMVSLAMLAIVLTAMVANMSTLASTTDFANEQETATNVMRHVMEKVNSATFTTLGETGSWSEAHFLTDSSGNFQAGLSATELQDFQIITGNAALENLEVFVEYYRGINASGDHVSTAAGDQGIMQWDDESETEYLARVSSARLDDGSINEINAYRLYNQQDVIGLGTDPVLIRVIVLWGDGSDVTTRRRIEMMTGRTDDTGAVN